jgi:aspartyl-tRNA(Asn)/glutamyl-tRNA(Gln) amidotransferase subunit C
MAELNEENIRYLTQLCRIAVEDKDIPLLFKQLKTILDYIDQLQEVDVSDLSPHHHVEPMEISTLREDVPETHLPREKFLKNAPETIGGMIRVPPVIQK